MLAERWDTIRSPPFGQRRPFRCNMRPTQQTLVTRDAVGVLFLQFQHREGLHENEVFEQKGGRKEERKEVCHQQKSANTKNNRSTTLIGNYKR